MIEQIKKFLSTKATEETNFFEAAPTEIEKVKSQFVDWVALVVPFALGILLAISNGYLFAGFKNFSLVDIPVFVAWLSGFAIEAAALAALFHSSNRLKSGNRREFWLSFAGAITLACISLVAQYCYLQMEYKTGSIKISDQAVDQMPIFNLLVGVNGFKGHDILFLIRSVAYHIAEFVCSFLIVRRGQTIQAALQRQRDIFEYKSQVGQQEAILSMAETLQRGIQAMMEQQQRIIQATLERTQEQLMDKSEYPTETSYPLAAPLLNIASSQQSAHQSLNGKSDASGLLKK
jgi:hypothetical protein